MQVVNISDDLLAKILVNLPKGTPIFNSFLKIANSVQNANNGLNGGYYSCGAGLYANIDSELIYTVEDLNGLNGFFGKIGGFIKRNVQSAVKDGAKIVKLAAPLLSVAAGFLPGGSVISGIVNKVIGASDIVNTADSMINKPTQQPVQEVAQPYQNVNQFGFPNTGTFTTPSQVPFMTQPQVNSIASLKNTDVESLKQELADLKEKELSKISASTETKTGFQITTPIAIGGVGVLGLIVYLATKK